MSVVGEHGPQLRCRPAQAGARTRGTWGRLQQSKFWNLLTRTGGWWADDIFDAALPPPQGRRRIGRTLQWQALCRWRRPQSSRAAGVGRGHQGCAGGPVVAHTCLWGSRWSNEIYEQAWKSYRIASSGNGNLVLSTPGCSVSSPSKAVAQP